MYDNLVLGETTTRGVDLTGECDFRKGDLVYFDKDTRAVKAIDSEESIADVLFGIIADDIKLEAEESGSVAVYSKGTFNKNKLNIGGDVTYDKVQLALDRQGIICRDAK